MLRVGFSKIAFRKTQVMDGIQQVGLTNAVIAAYANNTCCKRK